MTALRQITHGDLQPIDPADVRAGANEFIAGIGGKWPLT